MVEPGSYAANVLASVNQVVAAGFEQLATIKAKVRASIVNSRKAFAGGVEDVLRDRRELTGKEYLSCPCRELFMVSDPDAFRIKRLNIDWPRTVVNLDAVVNVYDVLDDALGSLSPCVALTSGNQVDLSCHTKRISLL